MKVLFVCTANSCRSQMAEAWARQLCPAGWEVASAGLLTYPITSPTRQAMAEAGLDMAGQQTKPIDRFCLDDFDLVVTLSEEASRFLPPLADPSRHLHRPVEDPMSARGSPEQIREEFRRARDRIREIVAALASAPDGSPPTIS